MGMSILANEDKTEAVIINDSVLPPYPLGVVFSVYDSESLDHDDIVELLNEFIDWCGPRDVRYLEPLGDNDRTLREKWNEFLEEKKRIDQANQARSVDEDPNA